MSQKERDRLKVMAQLQTKQLTQEAASGLLALCERQVRRLLRRSKIILENRLDGTQKVRWRNQYLRFVLTKPEKVKKPARAQPSMEASLETGQFQSALTLAREVFAK